MSSYWLGGSCVRNDEGETPTCRVDFGSGIPGNGQGGQAHGLEWRLMVAPSVPHTWVVSPNRSLKPVNGHRCPVFASTACGLIPDSSRRGQNDHGKPGSPVLGTASGDSVPGAVLLVAGSRLYVPEVDLATLLKVLYSLVHTIKKNDDIIDN
ncbi:hypothetical protein Bbelb_127110 [Branchiostoma belcheri]|nr:hypothetical protein Bbelb_127110 [Branchiostoma belcheri]